MTRPRVRVPPRARVSCWHVMSRFITPEAAALNGLRDAQLIASKRSPDESCAVVLFALNDGSVYQAVCERDRAGWAELAEGNGPGWTALSASSADEQVGVLTAWTDARSGARTAIVRFLGKEHHAMISRGYALFVAWSVPSTVTERPSFVRFS